jgi:hypothetical protein
MDHGRIQRFHRPKEAVVGSRLSGESLPDGEANQRQHLLDADVRLRIEELEHEVNFGRCAFLVLGDLLNNVRNNGGMTADLIDNTFAELVAFFKSGGPNGTHPMVKYIESMRSGDSST